ncbi:MAG: NTP transferase domain-containing protein [Planctomycetes bacterium]|nr:NTP transferase domain-containing protein [Planctomycetota bacterium]
MTSSAFMGVILAAGKGTRMQPFSEHFPKPILPLGGRPLIAHQLEIMRGLGVTEVVIVIGHLGHEVVRTLGDGDAWGMRITYVEQEQTLGIAHAVSKLEPYVSKPFFLFLGDIYFETSDLGTMVGRMREGSRAHGVLAVKREPDQAAIRRNFVVLTDGADRVVRVVEKPRHPRTDLKGCGIYLFDVTFFDAVRRTPRTALRDEYEITDSIQIFIEDGYRVEAAEVIRNDLNLSFPEDLLDLNLHWLDQNGKSELVGDGVVLHDGAKIEHSIVMAGATVENAITIKDSLVFPGVRVTSKDDLVGVILTNETEIHCHDR